MKKKKTNSAKQVQQKRIWATAQLYCEKKNLYCNLGFVLQEEGWLHERVSQYKNCIVTGAAGGLGKKTKKLYCDIAWWVENCITREGLLASVLQ